MASYSESSRYWAITTAAGRFAASKRWNIRESVEVLGNELFSGEGFALERSRILAAL